jgi:hypothetical protein
VVQNLHYVVIIVSRKLHHYFQAHNISMVMSYALRSILCNPDAMGNFTDWAAELAEFDLEFAQCHTVMSQAIADFVVEWTPSATPLEDAIQ